MYGHCNAMYGPVGLVYGWGPMLTVYDWLYARWVCTTRETWDVRRTYMAWTWLAGPPALLHSLARVSIARRRQAQRLVSRTRVAAFLQEDTKKGFAQLIVLWTSAKTWHISGAEVRLRRSSTQSVRGAGTRPSYVASLASTILQYNNTVNTRESSVRFVIQRKIDTMAEETGVVQVRYVRLPCWRAWLGS